MRFQPSKFNKISFLLALVTLLLVSTSSFSQTDALPTRVAITVSDVKTTIWLSDFPKKTSVMLIDSDNNLLGIITTNDFGAAYTTFSKPVVNSIVARTLNGEISVTNKASAQSAKAQETVVVSENKIDDKA